MKKALALSVGAMLALVFLTGCNSEAEVPVAPAGSAAVNDQEPENGASAGDLALTDADKLKGLSVGETAVWKDYEVTVGAIDRSNGQLQVQLSAAGHGIARTLGIDCLMSFGMPPISSTFSGGKIAVPAEGEVSGTLTFDDRYESQRLFWNDAATEATWLLDAPAVPDAKDDKPASGDGGEKADGSDNPQAIAAIEAGLPDLFSNWTYYTYRGVDSSTADVAPLENGGCQYSNAVSILDGAGNPATTNIRTSWDANGTCTSFELDGVLLF